MNDMALPALQGIELFSGVGMLGEGLRAGLDYLGLAYRTVCHVEREAYAASVLVARMEEGSMDAAPVWSDVCTFDARAWRGKVDCVVAGFPCQDLSIAGKRAGLDGKRSGLFFEVIRIADDSGAWLIVLENVAGIASATATVMDEEEGELDERAAARVLGELADLGWDAEWITLSASDVGASHGRARWFCIGWRMAITTDIGHERRANSGRKTVARIEHTIESLADASRHVGNASERKGGSGRRVCEAGNELADTGCSDARRIEHVARVSSIEAKHHVCGCDMAQPESIRRHQGRPESIGKQGRFDATECGVSVADSCNTGQQGSELRRALPCDRGGQEAHGSTSQLCGLFAPGPADPRWADIIAAEPYRAPALEPTFRGVVNGLAFDMGDCRAPRLKCGGNGVVALCASVALVILLRRAGIMNSIIADMSITRRAA